MSKNKSKKGKKIDESKNKKKQKDNNKGLKDLLKEVIIDVVGKQAEEIVDLINVPKHVNEFIIAKKMELTVNQVRNILYKLSDKGVVSYIRKKDKRKGWYTYFWRIEILRALEFLREILKRKIYVLNHQIDSRERKVFYVCKTCNVELTEEHALVYDFTCNECGNIFEVQDNSKFIKDMKKNLLKLEKELSSIQEEISIEKEKTDKKRGREIRKAEKEKKAKRMAKAKLRAAERKKMKALKEKATKKKSVKKKSVKKKATKKKPSKTSKKKRTKVKKKTKKKR